MCKDEMFLSFITLLINHFMISGLLKSALEETILDNVLCPQLLSTRVFHCSIWISQENICRHICFGTNEEKKYECLPRIRFIKN